MDSPQTISFQLEASDFEACALLLSKRSTSTTKVLSALLGRMVFGIGISLLVLGVINPGVIAVSLSQVWVLRDVAIQLLVMLGIMFFASRAKTQADFKKHFVAQAAGGVLGQKVDATITPQFFMWRDQNLALKIAWCRVRSVVKGTSHIFIFTHEVSVLIIPRRAFADAMAAHGFYEAAHRFWQKERVAPAPIPAPATR